MKFRKEQPRVECDDVTVGLKEECKMFKSSLLFDKRRTGIEKNESFGQVGGGGGLLTSAEAAELLRISVPTLHNLVSVGKVPAYKLGRRNRYKKEELLRLLIKKGVSA